jgi:hypothetical protein
LKTLNKTVKIMILGKLSKKNAVHYYLNNLIFSLQNSKLFVLLPPLKSPDGGIGRRAWLRAM